jgi:hypothetical protein
MHGSNKIQSVQNQLSAIFFLFFLFDSLWIIWNQHAQVNSSHADTTTWMQGSCTTIYRYTIKTGRKNVVARLSEWVVNPFIWIQVLVIYQKGFFCKLNKFNPLIVQGQYYFHPSTFRSSSPRHIRPNFLLSFVYAKCTQLLAGQFLAKIISAIRT